MGKLTIFRGLPGAGKSKLARQLAEQTGALFIEPDMLMIKHSKYCYEKELFKSAVAEVVSFMGAMHFFFDCDLIYADVLPTISEAISIVEAVNPDSFQIIDVKITPEESLEANRHHVLAEDIYRFAQLWEDWTSTEEPPKEVIE